jgi:hypothetical protein
LHRLAGSAMGVMVAEFGGGDAARCKEGCGRREKEKRHETSRKDALC